MKKIAADINYEVTGFSDPEMETTITLEKVQDLIDYFGELRDWYKKTQEQENRWMPDPELYPPTVIALPKLEELVKVLKTLEVEMQPGHTPSWTLGPENPPEELSYDPDEMTVEPPIENPYETESFWNTMKKDFDLD